jgi:hypothetical protein
MSYANVEIQIIETSQAPDAKPVAVSQTVTNDWEPIIEVPQYEIPELIFGGTTVVVPGVAEIISPLVVTNKTITTERISVRVWRYDSQGFFTVVNEVAVPKYDVLFVPLNGQFLYSGDVLEVKASATNAFDVTISYTVGQAEEDDVS